MDNLTTVTEVGNTEKVMDVNEVKDVSYRDMNGKLIDKKLIQDNFKDLLDIGYNSLQGVNGVLYIENLKLNCGIVIDYETLTNVLKEIDVIESRWIDPLDKKQCVVVFHYRERHLDNAIDRELNEGNWKSEREKCYKKVEVICNSIRNLENDIEELIADINKICEDYNNINIPKFEKRYGKLSNYQLGDLEMPTVSNISDVNNNFMY